MQIDSPIRPPSSPRHGELPYRLFVIHPVGPRITGSHQFHAPNDEAAIEIAEAWREGRMMELWQRARVVREWR